MLATGRPYQDLGADYFTTRIDPETGVRRRITKLEAHGFKVTLDTPPQTDPAPLRSTGSTTPAVDTLIHAPQDRRNRIMTR